MVFLTDLGRVFGNDEQMSAGAGTCRAVLPADDIGTISLDSLSANRPADRTGRHTPGTVVRGDAGGYIK